MPRPAAAAGAALWLAAVSTGIPAAAQPVPATNDVAACTLIADPTAQRSCIESAQQKRAATSFDPSATRLRGSHTPPQDGDLTGLRRPSSVDKRRRAPRRTGNAAPAAVQQPAQIP